ncbi:D-Tyr tRNAtyr deacylase-like domain-containing protein [Leucosporidium creatinivorum]|uniref:D-aminoacyl-tRNA deacylase n=1 Tax=Leucosporidium creatinivorum TaxID=106004 RepID=A0A1Y2G0F9_9BASI|nr:D-Tyr tRNAtyr deacylase-like domain-containing protein [Leucosporidium creatinivorum]
MVKAVIQRVRNASVTVDGKVVSSIGRGLMVLVGIGTNDTAYEMGWLSQKLLAMKLFPDNAEESWGWKKGVAEIEGEVLCVSQFTLCANVKKGSKPDFHGAMPGETSKQMYDDFLADLRSKYKADRIFDGQFGAMMDVQLINDGPATILLDSTTDAPAPPAPKKIPLTPAQKQQRKEDLARKAAARDEMLAKRKADAEIEAGKLADRFKEAMTEQY